MGLCLRLQKQQGNRAEAIQSLHEMEAETWSWAEGGMKAELEKWEGAGRGVMGLVRDNCLFSLLLPRKQEALLWL